MTREFKPVLASDEEGGKCAGRDLKKVEERI